MSASYDIWNSDMLNSFEDTEWSEDVNSASPGDTIDYINEDLEALMDPFCEVCEEIMENTCDYCGKYYCENCDGGNIGYRGKHYCENCDGKFNVNGEVYPYGYDDEAWPYK